MKNTFKLVLINTVACAAVLNNCGYTDPSFINNMNAAVPAFNNNMNNNMNFMPYQVGNNNMIVNNNINQLLNQNNKSIYDQALKNIDGKNIDGKTVTHTIGLANIGATCYMNAVLQCLFNIKSFSKQLIQSVSKNTDKNMNDLQYKVAVELANVAANLWSGGNNKQRYFSPDKFKDLLGSANPLFQGINANDSKDLIIFLYETLHNEFNKPNGLSKAFNTPNMEFNLFANQYFSQNKSFLTDLFYFIQQSDLSCHNCHNNKRSYNIANFIISPLEKVREMKLQNRNNKLNSLQIMQLNLLNLQKQLNPKQDIRNQENEIIGPITLEDCIDNFSEEEVLSGGNQIYCNNCNQTSNAATKNTLFSLPKVMTVILNRGKGLQYNVPVKFQKTIKIYESASNKWVQYKLKSFVTHLGESSNSGHFVANIQDEKGKWWFYNDATVTEQKDSDVDASLHSTKLENVPYILFYVRAEDAEQSKNNLGNNYHKNMVVNNNNIGCNNMMMPNMNYNFNNVNWNNMANQTPMAMLMNNMPMNRVNAMGRNMNNAMKMNMNNVNAIGMNMSAAPINCMNNNMMQNMNYNNNNLNYNNNCSNKNCMHQHTNNAMWQNQILNNAQFVQQNNNGMNFAWNNMNKFSNNVQNNNRVNRFNSNVNNNNNWNNNISNSAPNMQHINRGNVNQMNMGQINTNNANNYNHFNNMQNNNNYNNQNFNNNMWNMN